ncbi:hypothetical protein HDU97_007940 [Phlyctochytrium planicorne]|nr:hypothetical protein HDU97_007940 [Phlyctochytrium planicorne]
MAESSSTRKPSSSQPATLTTATTETTIVTRTTIITINSTAVLSLSTSNSSSSRSTTSPASIDPGKVTVTFTETVVKTLVPSGPTQSLPTTSASPSNDLTESRDSSGGGLSKGGLAAAILVPLIALLALLGWIVAQKLKRRESSLFSDSEKVGSGDDGSVSKESSYSGVELQASAPMFSIAADSKNNSRTDAKRSGKNWFWLPVIEHASAPNSPSLDSPMTTNADAVSNKSAVSPGGDNFASLTNALATLSAPDAITIRSEAASATHLVLHPDEPYAPPGVVLPPNHPLATPSVPNKTSPEQNIGRRKSSHKRRSASVGALAHRGRRSGHGLKTQKSFTESMVVDLYADEENELFEEGDEGADQFDDGDLRKSIYDRDTRKSYRRRSDDWSFSSSNPNRRSRAAAAYSLPRVVPPSPTSAAQDGPKSGRISTFKRRTTTTSDSVMEEDEVGKLSKEERKKKYESLYTLDGTVYSVGTRRTRNSRRESEEDYGSDSRVVLADGEDGISGGPPSADVLEPPPEVPEKAEL